MAKKKRNSEQDYSKLSNANADKLVQAIAQGICANPNHSGLTPAQIADLVVKITDEVIDLF